MPAGDRQRKWFPENGRDATCGLIYHQASHVTATAREHDVNHVIELYVRVSSRMRSTPTAVAQSRSARIQVKTYPFTSISRKIATNYSTDVGPSFTRSSRVPGVLSCD
jgi:hypothetical protein